MRRYNGYANALGGKGLRIDPALIVHGDFSRQSGREQAAALFAAKPTAIFASNDDMAAAAISVAHRRGLDVPRDLSVVGFDDSSAATTVWPELTTINQPIEAMTNTAIEVLVRGIRRNDASTRVLADHVIAHRLIGRDSVAKPPRSK